MPISRVSSDPVPFEAASGLGSFGWSSLTPTLGVDDDRFGIYQGTPNPAPAVATQADYGSGLASTFARFSARLGPPPTQGDYGSTLYDAWSGDAGRWPNVHLRIQRSGNTSLSEFLRPSLSHRFSYQARIYLPPEWAAASAALSAASTFDGDGGGLTILQLPFQRRGALAVPGQIKAGAGGSRADRVEWWPYWYDPTPLKVDIGPLSNFVGVWTKWSLDVRWFPSGADATLSVNDTPVWSVSDAATVAHPFDLNYPTYGLYMNDMEGTSASDFYDPGVREVWALYTDLRAFYAEA
jgi:hypothetical protein